MNNKQFVEIAYEAIMNNNLNLKGNHGNLLLQNGVLYSYGRHYPLMFKVGGHLFINNRGYSNTTAKHISLCRTDGAKYVELIGASMTLENVKTSLKETIERLEEELKHTKEGSKKNTFLKARLENTTETLFLIS